MNIKPLLLSAAVIAGIGFASPVFAQVSSYNSNDTLTPLSGLYVGGFAGYGWTEADVTGTTDFDVDGGDYGVFAGYQMDTLLDRTLGMGINGALELHYAGSDAEETQTIGGVVFNTEKNWEWGVSFRPGLSFVDQYAPFGLKPYGIIGYRQAEFEASSGAVSSEEKFDGFELGLGTELIAYNDFGVRLDYTHVWYGEEGGIDPDEDDIRLGVAYHF